MPKLSRVGIVGAGKMGAGITLKCAWEGLDAVMADLDQQAVDLGMKRIKSLLDHGLDSGAISPERAAAALMRIKGSISLEDLSGCHLVIEAVFEDLEVKKDLLSRLEETVGKDCVLATNTSSFRVEELARDLESPQRLVGLHFFSNPDKNRLLEIIPGEKTSQLVVEACERLAACLDKDAIISGDRPGFAINRFFIPWLNEAVRLWQEGLASAPAIDQAAREAFGAKEGPFAFLRGGGGEMALDAARSLGAGLGSFYAPAKALESGAGNGRSWEENSPPSGGAEPETVTDRLMGAVFLAAGQMLDEKVSTPREAELGAQVGLGWEWGPFGLMNRVGPERAWRCVRAAARAHGETTLPASLAETGGPWPLPLADYRKRREGVGLINLRRPRAGNAFTPQLLEDLEQAVDLAEEDQETRTIALKGLGGSFSVGLDAGYLLDELKNQRGGEIVEFAARGRRLLERLSASKKWVAAILDGPALGAGAELALACHSIVATPRGRLGFPETGMGIYPSLGGLRRSLRYLGRPLASYLVLTGRVLDAEELRQLGLVEYLVTEGSALDTVIQLSEKGNPLTKRGFSPVEPAGSWAELAGVFADSGRMEGLLGAGDQGERDQLEKSLADLLGQKAPLALKTALSLMNQEAGLDPEEGLGLEQQNLKAIFETKDALEGLSSVVEHRTPSYVGA